MNDIPGYEITEVLGEVFGLTVRSRNIGSQFGAVFKSVGGGELKGMTKNLQASRGGGHQPHGPVGRGARWRRGPRHAIRYVRNGWQLDRDLCLRHRGQDPQTLTGGSSGRLRTAGGNTAS